MFLCFILNLHYITVTKNFNKRVATFLEHGSLLNLIFKSHDCIS